MDGWLAVTATVVALALTAPATGTGRLDPDRPRPVDIAAPTIDTPGAGGVTGQREPLVGGRGRAGDTIAVSAGDGTSLCGATVTAAGTWACTSRVALGDGPVSLTATATDPAGNLTPGPPVAVTVDTTPPAAAAITSPATGSYVPDYAPLITGTAEPGATVTVADATGLAVCSVVAGPAPPAGQDATLAVPAVPAASLVPDSPAGQDAGWAIRRDPGVSIVSGPPAGQDAGWAIRRDPGVSIVSGPPVGQGATLAGRGDPAVSRVSTPVTDQDAGAWECHPARPFGDGPQRIVATVTDPAGNSTSGVAVTFTVDTVPPPAPRLTSPADGLVTRDARLAVSGTAEPFDLVAVRAGDRLLCTASAATATAAAATATSPNGAWACRAKSAVPDGPVLLRATATDRAGHPTAGGAATVTVDTVPPPAAAITSPVPGEILPTATPLIRGAGEPGDIVIVEGSQGRTVCVASVRPDGSWSCSSFATQPDGDLDLNTYALDGAGNSTHGAAFRVRIAAVQPVAATITAPGDGAIVAATTPLLGGEGAPGDTVQVMAAGSAATPFTACLSAVGPDGTWSCRPANPLPQGHVTLLPATIDGAGTRIPGSAISVIVDSVPPGVPAVTSPAAGATVRTTRPVVAGRGEAGSVIEVFGADGAAVCGATVDGTGRWSCPVTLPAGPVYLTPAATDAAGNATPGTPVRFTVSP